MTVQKYLPADDDEETDAILTGAPEPSTMDLGRFEKGPEDDLAQRAKEERPPAEPLSLGIDDLVKRAIDESARGFGITVDDVLGDLVAKLLDDIGGVLTRTGSPYVRMGFIGGLIALVSIGPILRVAGVIDAPAPEEEGAPDA